jgi:hypothetical protein
MALFRLKNSIGGNKRLLMAKDLRESFVIIMILLLLVQMLLKNQSHFFFNFSACSKIFALSALFLCILSFLPPFLFY